MNSDSALLLGLKSDFLAGLEPLKTRCARAELLFQIPRFSNVYRVEAGRRGHGWLSELRAVASVRTRLRPEELNSRLLHLNEDLAIECVPLLWGDEVLLNPQMPIPHPDLHRDPVFLQCASEVEPALLHPILGQTLGERLNDGGRSASLEFHAQGRHVYDPGHPGNQKRI